MFNFCRTEDRHTDGKRLFLRASALEQAREQIISLLSRFALFRSENPENDPFPVNNRGFIRRHPYELGLFFADPHAYGFFFQAERKGFKKIGTLKKGF